MNKTTLLAALALAGLALAGCGAHEHRGAGTEIDWSHRTKGLVTSLQLGPEFTRLAIGRVAGGAVGALGEPDSQGGLPADIDEIRRALRGLMEDSRAFEKVLLAEDARTADVEPDLLLEARIEKASLRRVERSDTGLLGVVSWIALGWLGDWQHGQTYEMEIVATFSILDARTRQPLLEVAERPGRAREELNLFERREGGVGVAATVCWWPGFALDSQANVVTRSLAPAALADPVRDVLDQLDDVHMVYRVQDPKLLDPSGGIRIDVLEPLPNAVVEGRTAVEVRVTVRPEAGRPARIFIGDHAIAANGPRISARVEDATIYPGKPLAIRVQLDKGEPVTAAELSVVREAMPMRALGSAGPGGSGLTAEGGF
jgi:hypothetical protein